MEDWLFSFFGIILIYTIYMITPLQDVAKYYYKYCNMEPQEDVIESLKKNGLDVDGLTEEQQLILQLATHRPRTREELWDYVKLFFGVEIPKRKICSGCCSPFDAFAGAYFAESPICIFYGNRGAGKSCLLSLLGMTIQLTMGCNVNIVGGSSEQSQRILSYIRGGSSQCAGMFWDCPTAPIFLIDHREENKRLSKLYNKGLIKCLTASSTSVRGEHVPRLLCDEIDCAEYQIIEDALSQAKSDHKRGIKKQIVLSSTWQNPEGTMTKFMKRARENGWPIYKWCWRETIISNGGWLPDEDIESVRKTVSSETFEREYNNQEPHGEGKIWKDEDIDFMFDRSLGEFKGKPNEICRIQNPHPELTFYHGADWAKKKDSTIITTFLKRPDGNPDLMANWLRLEKMKWDDQAAKFNEIVKDYGGSSAHDITGVGDVVNDLLTHESTPVDFRARKKIRDMLTDYVIAIERREIKAPFIEHAYYEHKYATYEQLYDTDHLPDSIASGAMAWSVRSKGLFSFLFGRP
jgi:hypothetical protein